MRIMGDPQLEIKNQVKINLLWRSSTREESQINN